MWCISSRDELLLGMSPAPAAAAAAAAAAGGDTTRLWCGAGGMTEEKKSARTSELAKYLLESVLQLGPTFIKVGQLSSTRSDLFPKVRPGPARPPPPPLLLLLPPPPLQHTIRRCPRRLVECVSWLSGRPSAVPPGCKLGVHALAAWQARGLACAHGGLQSAHERHPPCWLP
jgi:hypothetical protein